MHQLQRGHHRRQRVAELVSEHRQELVLGAIRLLGFAARGCVSGFTAAQFQLACVQRLFGLLPRSRMRLRAVIVRHPSLIEEDLDGTESLVDRVEQAAIVIGREQGGHQRGERWAPGCEPPLSYASFRRDTPLPMIRRRAGD